jgi:putative dimethyl sulfoxide reductase chaperone
MNARTTPDPGANLDVVRMVARSRAYGLFARAFRYPDEALAASLADGRFADELHRTIVDAYPSFADQLDPRFTADLCVGTDLEDLQATYLAAFENDLPAPSVSLYEGSYGTKRGSRPTLLIELKALYRHFGLVMAENDVEDALTAELEFMQFLAAKQAQTASDGGDAIPYLHAQRDFLTRHLAGWLPALEAELDAKLGACLHSRLGRVMTNYVLLDVVAVARQLEAEAPTRSGAGR